MIPVKSKCDRIYWYKEWLVSLLFFSRTACLTNFSLIQQWKSRSKEIWESLVPTSVTGGSSSLINGNECSGPMTIEAAVYNSWPSSAGSTNLLHHRSFEGYCENILQGMVRVELWVGKCPSSTLGDAHTGYKSVSRIMIEEVSRSQS